jgi:hypothetical protein
MNIKKRVKSYKNTEHYKQVKQAEKELDKRIQETSKQINKEYQANYLSLFVGLILALGIVGFALFAAKVPIASVLLGLIFFIFPILCQCYGVVVAGSTIFSGIKLSFSGQYFAVVPVLPFTIINPRLSYFCLGWGLLVASRRSHSKFGFLLGTANLLGGGLGLFKFKHVTSIVAPGFWGSAISGILTIVLGCSMIQVIFDSWSKSKEKLFKEW